MEEDGEDLSPFWLQSSTNHRRRRRSSPFLLNSGVLVFFLCVTAVLSIFFIIPSVLSFTSQIFRPNLVKKSWDSLNLVLVLLALIFGFLSRNRNYDTNFDEDQRVVSNTIRNEIQKSIPSTPHQWYEYSDRTVYGGGLRRVSCSYPDLREVVAVDDRLRFFDDTQVETHQYSQSDQLRRRPSWKRIEEELEEGSDQTKTIHVDTLEAKEAPYTPPQPPSSPPQPSPPPPEQPVVQRKPKRSYESIAEKRNNEMKKESEPTKTQVSPAVPDPLPSPSIHRERSVDNFLTSLRKKKKKKQRQRSVENFETLLQPQTRPLSLQPPPSPPPPPPPPPSVFQNLFSSKKGKNKKYISVPPPPPPPPPFTVARASKTTSQISPVVASEPPMPVNLSSFNSGGESPLMGNKSPLIPIPPPPPPPPFKMPSWKFLVKGDYVRIGSMDSSRSGSPDLDDIDSPRSDVSSECGVITAVDGGEVVAPTLFCPSPDVNTKADMFIAKFRAGLKLQKINSIKQKGLGLSNLGPETKPGQ